MTKKTLKLFFEQSTMLLNASYTKRQTRREAGAQSQGSPGDSPAAEAFERKLLGFGNWALFMVLVEHKLNCFGKSKVMSFFYRFVRAQGMRSAKLPSWQAEGQK